MGRKKSAASPRELKAAEFLFQGPFLTTSQAMKAANYSTSLRPFVSRAFWDRVFRRIANIYTRQSLLLIFV